MQMQLVVTNPTDRNGHEVLTFSARTIKLALKEKGIVGKPAQQIVRDQLRAATGQGSDFLSGFVRDGGVLQSIKQSQTKDGRIVVAARFEQPKVSEIEKLREELAAALEANSKLLNNKK